MILGKDPTRALGIDGRVPIRPQMSYGDVHVTDSVWEAGVFEFPSEFGAPVRVLYEMPPKDNWMSGRWDIQGTLGHLSGDKLVLYNDGNEAAYPFEREFAEIDGQAVIKRVYVKTDPPIVWENPLVKYRIGSSASPADYAATGMDEIARGYTLLSMHGAITENTKPAYGPFNARADLEAWIAVRESAWRGNTWMDMPLREETSVEKRLHAAYRAAYGVDISKDIDAALKINYPRAGVLWDVLGWL
jgi:hypothetical protein